MRRHHCFSLLFPNSTPANRKQKNSATQVSPQPSNNLSLTNNNNNNLNINNNINNNGYNVDADSTTPRMFKKFKKEFSKGVAEQFKNNDYSTTIHLNDTSNITIHPTMSKMKRFKNILSHERSLISTVSPTMNGNAAINQSQSMLRPTNGCNSPSSSASSPHQSSSSSPTFNNVPTNNLRIQNSKNDLRERLIQFCSEELVPLKSVNSESFRIILQSHLRLCTNQILQQFSQQPQLANLATTLSTFMNHLPSMLPDMEHLGSSLEFLYKQCRDKIRQDVILNLENNVGSALVCDSDNFACIISVYYVDTDWRLVEAVLSASTLVLDINQFVSRTLENYILQDRKKLSKFTFVSHGGQFGGVSVCLSSMAHIIDKVVDEALSTLDEQSSNNLPHLSDLFDLCHEVAVRFNIPIETNQYDVDWISKYELMKSLLEQQEMITAEDCLEKSIDFKLMAMIVKLLEPFRTASHELRQCFHHPTLCYVLLYFHKLKKVLSTNANNHQLHGRNNHLINNKNNRSSKMNSSNKSSNSESDSDSTEEKDIDLNNVNGLQAKNTNEDEESIVNANLLMEQLKQILLDNLNQYYQVQSLHRIATFLWPNFRLLKMLTAEEQKEVHEDVRKLIQTRVKTISNDGDDNGENVNDSNRFHSNDRNNGIDISNSNGSSNKNKSRSNFDEWEIFSDEDQDEVDKYLSVQLTSCSEQFVLNWWKEHSNEFPKLSQLAKWVHSIPASVTTRERFQITKNNQIDDRLLFLHCNM